VRRVVATTGRDANTQCHGANPVTVSVKQNESCCWSGMEILIAGVAYMSGGIQGKRMYFLPLQNKVRHKWVLMRDLILLEP
jgi:hypothetical protein